jgi:cytochrome b561
MINKFKTWKRDAMENIILGFLFTKYDGVQAAPHTWSTKWVHWVAGALLAFAGFVNGKVAGALFSSSTMMLEVIVGIAIALLYIFLWFWLRGPGGGSRLPISAPRWERLLAKLVHTGLYLCIAGALLTGFSMAYLAPTDVVVNASAEQVLSLTQRFSMIRDVHEFISQTLGWLVVIHIVGAVWHRLVRHDGVLQSILPKLRSKIKNKIEVRIER